jgi:hypothetical protein
MPIVFSSPSPLFWAIKPTSGKITSLGIGGKITSRKAAAKTAGYPYSPIRTLTASTIPLKVPPDTKATRMVTAIATISCC